MITSTDCKRHWAMCTCRGCFPSCEAARRSGRNVGFGDRMRLNPGDRSAEHQLCQLALGLTSTQFISSVFSCVGCVAVLLNHTVSTCQLTRKWRSINRMLCYQKIKPGIIMSNTIKIHTNLHCWNYSNIILDDSVMYWRKMLKKIWACQ